MGPCARKISAWFDLNRSLCIRAQSSSRWVTDKGVEERGGSISPSRSLTSFTGGDMNIRNSLVAGLTLILLGAPGAQAKKRPPERGMLVRMESMECGVHQGGLAGLGGFWASIGVTKVTSQDKLCPQYLVETDTMQYHIRPMDKK